MHAVKSFRDRKHAGKLLAERLREYSGQKDVLVLGLPRGGVPVAREVAQELSAKLDVFVVRKLGVPWQSELAMGAIGSGGACHFNEDIISGLNISAKEISEVKTREMTELERREALFRGVRPPYPVAGQTVIIVDDGLATGATMIVAIEAIRAKKPRKLVVAVPVAPIDSSEKIRGMVDEFVCLNVQENFWGVGGVYAEFGQVSNEDVIKLLKS